MERVLRLGLILIPMLLLIAFFMNHSLAQTTTTDLTNSWKKCPYYGFNVMPDWTPFPIRSELLDPDVGGTCSSDSNVYETVNKYFMLNATWENAPYEDEEINGETVKIESIKLNVTARGCSKACNFPTCSTEIVKMDVYTWDYDWPYPNKWRRITNPDPIEVGDRKNYQFDVPIRSMESDNGVYHVMISNHMDSIGKCLYIFYLELEINYYLMGDAKIYNSLDIDPPSISKYSSFSAIGNITCVGGDCGNVYASLKWANDSSGPYQNIPTSLDAPMYISDGNNPHNCGYMNHDSILPPTCSPNWIVTGTKAGNYYVKMISSGNVQNETDPIIVSINPGVMDMSGSIGSNNINLSEEVWVYGDVECLQGGAPCGYVSIVVRYKDINRLNVTNLNSSGNLSTTNNNPKPCGVMDSGYQCSKNWPVLGNVPGTYKIRVVAFSDDEDVTKDAYKLDLIVNPEEAVGVLTVSAGLDPNVINVSENTTLSGTVSCSEANCGNVWVRASYSGDELEIHGQNPRFCGNMYKDGNPCNVQWNVTGNNPGSYYLTLSAYSENPETQNGTTFTRLDVKTNVGQFNIFSFDFDKSLIDENEFVDLNSTITCSNEYCGNITALISYNTTGLSTQSPNPQYCIPSFNYPCELFWNVTGDKDGSYTVNIRVTSNESVFQDVGSATLAVTDPQNPQPVLTLDLEELQDQYVLGTTFTLKGYLTCDIGDCGDVNVYAKYSEGSWQDMSPTTPLSTSEQNPKSITLNYGESQEVSWVVNSSVIGAYGIGILADALNVDVIEPQSISYQNIEIIEGVNIGIDIQSPVRGETLARGDEFLLETRIMDNEYPLIGGFVTASSEGLFSAVQLNESVDGIYSKTIGVGNTITKGSYIITVFVKKDSQTWTETTNVYVNPELDVSLETDKNDYEILDKVTLQGQVLKNGKPVKASIKLKLVCPSRSFMEITLDTDNSGNYLHEYLISMATPAEVCRFELNTEDSEGNYNFTSKDLRIFPSEKEVYRIDFLSPSLGSKYKKGESVKIRTEVSYGDDPLEGAEVLCINPMFEESIALNEVGNGVYDGDYIIAKEAPLDLWILTCVAKTPDGYFGRKSVNVYITSLDLKLTRISPSQTSFQPGDVANILLKLTYPDNTPFENGTVYLKIGNQIIYMNETDESGVYEVDYNFEDQGVFTFDVYAEDLFGNTGSFPGDIVLTAGFTPFSLLWFILPFLIAVMLLAGVVWKRGGRKEVIIKEEPAKPRFDRKTEVKNKIAELEKKVKNIQKSKDVVEQEYYERKIDEKTFNRMVQNYEQEVIALNVEIEELKKELARL